MISPDIFSKFIRALSRALPKWAPNFNDPETLDVWYQSFKHLSVSELELIFAKAKSSFDEFPSMRKLLMLADENSFNEETDPRDAASRIISAVSKYGYANPNEARVYIGELGWEVVSRYYGNWAAFCEVLTPDNMTTVQAQLRELCKTVGIKFEKGEMLPPGLPTPRDEFVGNLISGLCENPMQLKPMDEK